MARAKVLIVTLPIGENYGGILQAYALQRYITEMGFDVATTSLRRLSRPKAIARFGYHQIKRIIHFFHPTAATLTPEIQSIRANPTQEFIDGHIQLVDGKHVLSTSVDGDWAAIVVGSDQVWRKAYSFIEENLLDFAEEWNVIRISYAASFGRDDLSEYPPELVSRSAELAKKFDAISVRETSGIDLVEKNWHISAEQHLDPTMLFSADHYRALLKDSPAANRVPKDCLFVYVLDRDEAKDRIIESVAVDLGIVEFDLLPPPVNSKKELMANLEGLQLPPVTDWLQSFQEARFIVTDSFHGTIFSILFRKPVLVIGNPRRGLARIHSLLELFSMQDRLVESESQITEQLLTTEPDWEHVDFVLGSQRHRSAAYLSSALGSLIEKP